MRVAIIGAGFAGLAAARALVQHGVAVEILEATSRAGGRARSAHGTAELGPEFVHGDPPATLEIVRAAGLTLDEASERTWRDGELTDDTWARFGELLAPATQQPHDESARAYGERIARPDDLALFAMLVEGFYAASLDDISIASVAADASAGSQYRVRGGYHRVIAWLLAQLAQVPIHYEHPVHAIDWRDGVQIAHAHGMARVDRVIVTVPVGVLHAGTIAFVPPLAKDAALARIAMGQVVKVVTCFRERVWPAEVAFVHADKTRFPTFWLRSEGDVHQLTAWAGGPHAHALAGYAHDRLAEAALDEFATAMRLPRATLEAARSHAHYHDYHRDPYARGAYSYTRVGGGGAAEELARPLANRLFLAGEATDREFEGTVAGAIASGQRAARQVLASR